ncbi:LutC/YkgG family protein [Sanguibacter inulinus]|uniref:LUD domain-containing protein n=1 Tax=Sanguibacter inulinus TaxID=60922 RepID=A0A853EWZ0_9MICO|nr:LUD domain-containing protein [Sanguibacter inulinus]MBF0723179.1 LUD domain-containing protein [Sanguibacter inulinus]NYS94324.1 LUD domain-containing protein [Sanguibacter inulinus]
MSAREEIMGRVRAALSDVTASGAPVTSVEREYRTSGPLAVGSDEAVEMLVDRLVDYRATVHHAVDDAAVARVVAEIVHGLPRASSIVVPSGIDRSWLAALPTSVEVLDDSREHPMSALELDEVDAVITASRVSVADTGTIVLDGEPDQGRRAVSLVPDVHVCIVRRDQVVETVPEGVAILAEHPDRPQTWISGPSATSDIELSRVEGVHGPRTLHVVIAG